MATSAGELIYTVDMDTSKLISVNRQTANEISKTDKIMRGFDEAIQQAENSMSHFAPTMTGTAKAVKEAGAQFQFMKGGMSGVGFQLQDIAVQAQMGTSAFVILGQQGSQIASLFGPGGAMVGAFIAVGAALASVLAPSLMESKSSAELLEESLSSLGKIMTTTGDDADVLTDRILKLAKANQQAAKTEVALGITKAKDAIAASNDIIGEAITKADGWTNATGNMVAATSQIDDLDAIMKRFGITQEQALDGSIPAAFQSKISDLSTYVNTLGSEFGMTQTQALEFVRAADEFSKTKSVETAENLSNVINKVNEANGYANRSLVELGATIGENVRVMQDAADKAAVLESALDNIEQAASRSEEAIKRNTSAINSLIESAKMEAATIGKSARERALYVAELAGATDQEKELINVQYDSIEAQERQIKAAKDAQSAAKKAASDAANEQKRLQGQYQSNENSLKKMAQQLSIAGLSTQGLARDAAQLAAVYSLGEGATQTQIEQARQLAGALYDANQQMKEQKKIEDSRKKVETDFEGVKRSVIKTEDVDAKYKEDLAKLDAYYQQAGKLDEGYQATKSALERQYREARQAAVIEDFKAQSEANEFLMNSIDAFGQASTNAISGLLSGTMSATEAIQNFANVIMNQAIGALVEIGLQYVKNQVVASSAFAAEQAMNATKGAAMTAAVTAQVGMQTALAAQAAFAATAAIPIVGPALAPAAAGAAAATAQALGTPAIAMAPLAGAREFGGPVDAGKMYRVGEGGAPEIFQSGGKNFMIPGDGGKVIPNDKIGGGGFSQNVQVHNYSGENVQTKTSMDGKQLEVVIGEVAKQISQRRGGVGRALASSTATKWKAQ